jgi:putative two-component system response regulator
MIDLDEMISKQNVLLVDDNPENIHVLRGILEPYYKINSAINGNLAIKIACSEEKPDIILLDTMMPNLDGFAVCKYLKLLPETSNIPIVFVSEKSEEADEKKGFDLGAVDYITKPVSPPLVLARVGAHLKLADQKSHLMSLVKEKTADLEKTRIEIIESLGRAAEFKDNETGMHVVRMSWYSYFLAKRCTGNNNWSELLRNAAPMHDIGKIGVPDEVLLKPGKLNADEWITMQKHVQYGVEILGVHETDLLALALEVVQYHHEKWDGSGYPNGVRGEDIPLSARIVAIADVFDALTSERPYKKAWTVEKTMNMIESEAGKHFDPDLVPQFKACLKKVLEIKEQYTD